jgi:hypothetical protein
MTKHVLVILFTLPGLLAASTLYGGLGGHSNGDSTNDGALGVVDPNTGVVSIVGHPAGVARITGLAFGLTGTLYGTTQIAGGFPPPPGPVGTSSLIRIDPNTGALLSSIGITDGTHAISIADLAVQPVTGLIYGIRSVQDGFGGFGNLYTINPVTGLATLVGSTGYFFGSIAFAPNGSLYMSAADLDANDNFIILGLKTLNPSNASVLSTVSTIDFFGALAFSPEGVLYGGNGDQGQLFRINTVTGAETLAGSTGRNFVGDLAFAPVPEPGTFALVFVAVLALARRRR